jgi:hypothetical protein
MYIRESECMYIVVYVCVCVCVLYILLIDQYCVHIRRHLHFHALSPLVCLAVCVYTHRHRYVSLSLLHPFQKIVYIRECLLQELIGQRKMKNSCICALTYVEIQIGLICVPAYMYMEVYFSKRYVYLPYLYIQV